MPIIFSYITSSQSNSFLWVRIKRTVPTRNPAPAPMQSGAALEWFTVEVICDQPNTYDLAWERVCPEAQAPLWPLPYLAPPLHHSGTLGLEWYRYPVYPHLFLVCPQCTRIYS